MMAGEQRSFVEGWEVADDAYGVEVDGELAGSC